MPPPFANSVNISRYRRTVSAAVAPPAVPKDAAVSVAATLHIV
jgi:hypothetical protein